MKGKKNFILSIFLTVLMCMGSMMTASGATVVNDTNTATCPNCKNGAVACSYCGGKGSTYAGNPCFLCNQTGKMTCKTCNGTGKYGQQRQAPAQAASQETQPHPVHPLPPGRKSAGTIIRPYIMTFRSCLPSIKSGLLNFLTRIIVLGGLPKRQRCCPMRISWR